MSFESEKLGPHVLGTSANGNRMNTLWESERSVPRLPIETVAGYVRGSIRNRMSCPESLRRCLFT